MEENSVKKWIQTVLEWGSKRYNTECQKIESNQEIKCKWTGNEIKIVHYVSEQASKKITNE